MNDGIQFAEVFDSKDFPDNDTLSLYMGLSSQLSQKKGTMLLTYGYSGVGKTVTLFGNKKKKIFGLLQRTLLNVKSQGKILFRVFELYGKGFKYFFYWKNLKNTHQYIYNYRFKKSGKTIVLDGEEDEIPDKDIASYSNQINEITIDNIPESYIEIDFNVFQGFDEIVDQIDDRRIKTGRIKSTVNNPSSSRSIVLYEFEILIDGTFIPFIVMDLPGKENIAKTFIDLDDDFDIYNDPIKDNLIRASMYLDPMYLPTLDSYFSHYIIDYVRHNHKREFNDWLQKSQYMAISKHNEIKTKVLNDFSTTDRHGRTLGTNQYVNLGVGEDFLNADKIDKIYKTKVEGSVPINVQISATELMKYLIENSYFEIIEGIIIYTYQKEKNLTEEQLKRLKHNVSGAFEGIYINENILGIITYIIKDVMNKDGRRFIQTQSDPNEELKQRKTSEKGPITIPDGGELFTTTLDALTFDFRDFLRVQGNEYMNYIDSQFIYSKFTKPRGSDDKQFLSDLYTKIEKSYDYSKTYNYDKPLIADILKPFLDKLENYYMFYLLTNNDPDFKCEKQMKLLDVSMKFIQAMNPKL